MAQHFLLSSEAKSISLMDIMTMSDGEAWNMLREARWQDSEPICPKCGSEAAWTISTRRQWRCKSCNHTYSVTSGTIFDNRKLPIKTCLLAILIFSNAAKGISALQLSRDLNVHYRTAYVIAHKIREALLVHRDDTPFKGVVEIDGAYTGTYVRPENRKEERKDRRSEVKPSKRCVMVLRQRGGHGADRTLTQVAMSENIEEMTEFITSSVVGGTEVHADENAAYDGLSAWYKVRRVNHSREYSGTDGENVNQAESYFSRFRRFHFGQVHRMSLSYLPAYANEIAYREDTRRWSNRSIFTDLSLKTMRTPIQMPWRRYGRGSGSSLPVITVAA